MSETSSADCFFLSYSRSDEAFALRLAKDLRERGVGIWVDQLDIRPSEQWDRAIERAVRDCRGMVVILSPRSVLSNNVADEISFAIDNSKSVMPVMIEKCVLPLRITRMQVIDATGSYERALDQCTAEMRRASPDCVPAAAPGPTPAKPGSPAVDESDVAAAAQMLTPFMGPIAGIVAKREGRSCGSYEELRQRLAALIPDEIDRASFLAQSKRS
jgi:hypothetical protein